LIFCNVEVIPEYDSILNKSFWVVCTILLFSGGNCKLRIISREDCFRKFVWS